jgi:hypothetical protein
MNMHDKNAPELKLLMQHWCELRERFERDSDCLTEEERDRLAGLELRFALEDRDQLLRDGARALWECLANAGADRERASGATQSKDRDTADKEELVALASLPSDHSRENAGSYWVAAKSPDSPRRLKAVIDQVESRGTEKVRLRDMIASINDEQGDLTLLELEGSHVSILIPAGVTLSIKGIPLTSAVGERRRYRRENVEAMTFSCDFEPDGRLVEIRLE